MPATAGSARPRTPDRRAARGQVIVIFTLSIFLFVGMCAVVVDAAWYWANNLRIQRAADAAALAGVVWLPGDATTAVRVAREEATKNGYTSGIGGYTVTPRQDPDNPRRMMVNIRGPVRTYFANLFGLATFNATRDSKAEYVLPVPMGSPQNYYGVGFYEQRVPTVTASPASMVFQAPSNEAGGGWSGASKARTNNENNGYATATTSGSSQTWRNFGLLDGGNALPDDPTLAIDRVEVELRGVSAVGSGAPTDSCTLSADVSWDGGGSWSSSIATSPLGDDAASAEQDRTVGSAPTPLSDWGVHAWARNDFSNGNFRVRLTWTDGTTACPSSRNVQLDQLRVRVSAHTAATTYVNQAVDVPSPGGGTLASQGFWGAMFTPGGIRTNGDRYGPADIGYHAVGNPGRDAMNPDYDGHGYDYLIELGANGAVQLFDPIFCATGDNGRGGSYGAGDHWTEHATGGGSSDIMVGPIGATYSLYDAGTNLYSTGDDTWISDLRYDPGNRALGDFSGRFGVPQNQADGINGSDQDCATDPAHNAWVLPPGWSGLSSGFYRLNVNTSVRDHGGGADSRNFDTGAENLFSIWVGATSGNARVYGGGRMVAYTNLDAGNQSFYLAQIEGIHAGKTMVITLFDPGESNGNAFLRVLSPQGGTYHRATFDWTSDDGRSGDDVTQIQTSNGSPLFDNKIVTIRVPLPADYGTSDLDPNGLGEDGWWRIEYETSAANDTTTWQVELIGNPVHLIVP